MVSSRMLSSAIITGGSGNPSCLVSSGSYVAATAGKTMMAMACNMYISCGGNNNDADWLCDLLSQAQQQCNYNNNNNRSIAVVHAFADGPYDRSSFHFVANTDAKEEMIHIVSNLSVQVMKQININNNNNNNNNSRHPTVGKVDHISIMPLSLPTTIHENDGTHLNVNNENNVNYYEENKKYCVEVAHGIGQLLSSSNHENESNNNDLVDDSLQILYYGDANSQNLPLAKVRQTQTNFFKHNQLNNNKDVGDDTCCKKNDVCVIGVPSCLVENVNIRCKPGFTKKQVIQKITKHIRSRDDNENNLPHVEALTLPYYYGATKQYEVACNLLQPHITSMNDIVQLIQQKLDPPIPTCNNDQTNAHNMVESIYRVGTTAQQCLDVLTIMNQNPSQWQRHNEQVMQRFKSNLSTFQVTTSS